MAKLKRMRADLNYRLVSTSRTCLCVAGTKYITDVCVSRDSKGDQNYIFTSLLEIAREVKHKRKEKQYEFLIEVRTSLGPYACCPRSYLKRHEHYNTNLSLKRLSKLKGYSAFICCKKNTLFSTLQTVLQLPSNQN